MKNISTRYIVLSILFGLSTFAGPNPPPPSPDPPPPGGSIDGHLGILLLLGLVLAFFILRKNLKTTQP